ncbi:MAG: toxin-activating lysine-acyltransferase [Terricaulis sp.]
MGLFSNKPKSGAVEVAAPAGVTKAAAPAGASDAEKRAAMVRAQQVYASLGRIVTVMMRSPRYQDVSLGYIEGLAAPALSSGQFAIANAHDAARGMVEPVALVLWTSVSRAVDARLSKLGNKPMALTQKDWGSGDIPWLVALVGDQRLAQPMLTNLQYKTLNGRPLKARIKEKGKVVVREVSPTTLLPEHLAL